MAINRQTFFAYARRAPFGNRLTQQQIDGMEDLLDEWEEDYSRKPLTWVAYIFATVFHETGGRMVPVREGFATSDAGARKVVRNRNYGKPVDGFCYYGRGRVQNTWLANYKNLEARFDLPFTTRPDLLLDSKIDAQVTVVGLVEGLWTGKKLKDYFDGIYIDPVNARAIVNGRDKAQLVASYYAAFLSAFEAADTRTPQPADVDPKEAKADAPVLSKDKTVIGAITSAAGAGGLGFFGAIDNAWAFAAFLAALVVVAVGVILFTTGRLQIVRKAGA